MLDYIEGGLLIERIKELNNFSERKAIKVIRCFLSALDYLHENNVVHRDLKPANLLLQSNSLDCDDLIIADFGLADFITDGKKLKLGVGSPGYIAPEILKG